MGDQVLARWLLHPTTRENALARQAAVKELRVADPEREGAAVRSAGLAQHFRPDFLRQWGESPAELFQPWERWLTNGLVLANAAAIAAWMANWIAGAWVLLIMIFMVIYYKLGGVNAVIALIFNLVILLGLMAYFGATMTLPGIAGFVLTMGMGVDSNVLIFERIKEELEAQRGVRASINAGFSRVFLTLLDTHVASLIAAAFLFQFGTGPIRGFATTLSIGLFVNLFTSIFVSKTLFELELSRRKTQTISI